jgi:hypothetical protein
MEEPGGFSGMTLREGLFERVGNVPGGNKGRSRWSSAATPPERGPKNSPPRGGVAEDLLSGLFLAPLRGARTGGRVPGGVASLDPRLLSEMPSASASAWRGRGKTVLLLRWIKPVAKARRRQKSMLRAEDTRVPGGVASLRPRLLSEMPSASRCVSPVFSGKGTCQRGHLGQHSRPLKNGP